MIEINCTNCGKCFKVKPHIFREPTKLGRFCSSSCRSTFSAKTNPATQKNRVITNCSFCGKELMLQPNRILEKNFCDNSCAGKYGLSLRWPTGAKTVTVTCAFCGIDKTIPAWEYDMRSKRGQSQFFCNRSCFGGWKSANWNAEHNPAWKGGWNNHGSGWNMMRNLVRIEQNYACDDCGISEVELGRAIDVHHIVPARLFKRKADSNFRENLVGLCHACHMERENFLK